MKIGIISDTHDDIDNIKKAVKIFKDKGIKTVIHLGDIVAPPAIKFFKGFKLIGIFGNNERPEGRFCINRDRRAEISIISWRISGYN